MKLHVLFFGLLRENFGYEEWLPDFPGETVADLLERYRECSPALAGIWGSVAVAVNQQYASASQSLHDDDEVALLPPVSGGYVEPHDAG